MHVEIMKLQLLRRHICRWINFTIQVLLNVPGKQTEYGLNRIVMLHLTLSFEQI